MNYTEGPWVASHNPVTTDLNAHVSSSDGRTICKFNDPRFKSERFPGFSEHETLANAQLIAAAPDLFEALQFVLDSQYRAKTEDCSHLSGETFRVIYEAMQKARGKR